VRHLIENPGSVRRLTAAIVVNDRLIQAAGKGKAAEWQPRSADEVRNLTALAQAAVGFDGARGDLLTVEDLPFDENRSQKAATALDQALTKAEGFPVLIKYGALLAGLLVVVAFGVRPALRMARTTPGDGKKKGAAKEVPASGAQTALRPPEPAETDPERIRNQDIFDQVTGHLKREPTQSSRLLQSWIHSD
jgi:flagellar M-ring protein FliF